MESAGVPRKVRFKRKGKLWLSHKCTPSVDELAEFESGLLKMVHNIEFRPVRNNFLSKLKDDGKVINIKGCGLSITIQCNLKTVDFLDVTFDLDNNAYKPFHKENNKPIYINKHSNDPPSILKQLPKSIEKRIFATSSNKNIFNQINKAIRGWFKSKWLQ